MKGNVTILENISCVYSNSATGMLPVFGFERVTHTRDVTTINK